LELTPDSVGDPALERSECFFAGLAFGLSAKVVGASGCVVTDLGDGDDVDRVVQLAVAARVQPVSLPVGAGRFDRCGPVVAGELGAGPEPADVVDVSEHDRGDHGADTMEFGERCSRRRDGVADPLFDGVEVGVDAADVSEVVRRQRTARATSHGADTRTGCATR
jgi:hypothetical protein